MTKAPPSIAAIALVLAGCERPTEPVPDPTPVAAKVDQSPDARLCASIKSASTGGDAAMQGVLATDPVGNEYGGTVIRQLVSQGKFKFDGSEMIQGHCWAYARAKGKLYEQDIDLKWRCPVTAVSDNPEQLGQTALEEVDPERCDFDVDKGEPTKREIKTAVEHISLGGS